MPTASSAASSTGSGSTARGTRVSRCGTFRRRSMPSGSSGRRYSRLRRSAESDIAVVSAARRAVRIDVGEDANSDDVPRLLAERAAVVLPDVAPQIDPAVELALAGIHGDQAHALDVRTGHDGARRHAVQPHVDQGGVRQRLPGDRLRHAQLHALLEVELLRVAMKREHKARARAGTLAARLGVGSEPRHAPAPFDDRVTLGTDADQALQRLIRIRTGRYAV